ncbi:DDE-type integrase/transposase/recombinase [Pseudoalteromonas luteoviolacea]|uniref:Mu transposase C-terminal domain-containing protein n=1 Tax=Pseudoalteromonas luteoviolacea TaxID=43657 RepID=UPI001EEE39AA|nr:Mu transposase C-terminal domain-containing protein [Pseudoalteromonas luteoviolacea]MCF6441044.1 DDE-type integrase/transposase/recombinase [Pseudoalteromonas luteoviolacea]
MSTRRLTKGCKVQHGTEIFEITRVVNLEYLIAKNIVNNELSKLPIKEVSLLDNKDSIKVDSPDLTEISNENWTLARKRLEIIQPLLELGANRQAKHVSEQAHVTNTSPATLYRWLNKYQQSGKLSSLIRRTREDKNSSRLSDEQEVILISSIEAHFLKQERPKVTIAYQNYKLDCAKANLSPISYRTYLRKVHKITPQLKAEKRHGKAVARQKHEPKVGSFPQGRFPLDVVQIDHTKPNVILVDDDERKPIGRPWVTFAIDIYSRMILGFYLSLEAPSATSVALCMTHAMNRKETWLRSNNIDADWPCWGMIRVLHADNGPDFRCKALDTACYEYQIQINWRPLGRPDFGGHVERLMRTVKVAMNDIKGTTFENPQLRGDYDSEGNAVFSFSEFQKWLVTYITEVYHKRKHSAIHTSPIAKFEEGLFQGTDSPSLGLPEIIENEHRLYLDFLPFHRRTVQSYGVTIDNIYYFHPVISKWVGVPNPNTQDGKFIIKYELHQISHVFFLDPDTGDYIEIPRVQRTAPDMTRFELRKVQSHLKQQGNDKIDEAAIIDGYRKLNEIAEGAAQKTKAQRRMNQRKKQAKQAVVHLNQTPQKQPQKQPQEEGIWEDVKPFDNLDLDV